jgi:hypothetical protein
MYRLHRRVLFVCFAPQSVASIRSILPVHLEEEVVAELADAESQNACFERLVLDHEADMYPWEAGKLEHPKPD